MVASATAEMKLKKRSPPTARAKCTAAMLEEPRNWAMGSKSWPGGVGVMNWGSVITRATAPKPMTTVSR